MRKVLAQFLPLIVLLVVLASIMQVFATTEKSAGDKLSVWDRFLIAIGLREKPAAEETRKFEYIPSRLQQPAAPNYQLPATSDQLPGTNYPTPASRPPIPPIPPLAPRTLGVKTTSDVVKTQTTVTGFFGGILRSIIADLGLSKPPKPPIPPVLPKTLGVQDQKPALSPVEGPLPPPIPPLAPR